MPGIKSGLRLYLPHTFFAIDLNLLTFEAPLSFRAFNPGIRMPGYEILITYTNLFRLVFTIYQFQPHDGELSYVSSSVI